ncbi:AAA family ATPase [uncultured Kordia sp.]|uniref:AAA family ATPase n=1 Tax=uncultured Kordia sp. TaxID=507699 RepID=UPI00261600FF|nr:AAA family ATPase [uncultured Kordia sp.]
MIKVDRHKIAIPAFFSSKEYEQLQQEINDFYSLHKNSRAQRTFTEGYLPNEVSDMLAELFDHKCAFCESHLRRGKPGYESYLNRFRPTKNSQGFDTKEIDQDHYWWLTYEWENLYMICHACQRFKSNVFPVEGKRATMKTSYDQISKKENAFLIDPCNEDPSQFFDFNLSTLEIIPKQTYSYPDFLLKSTDFSEQLEANIQRAEATIQILGLNRTDLIDERENIAREIQKELNSLQTIDAHSKTIAEDWNEIIMGKSHKNHLAFRKKYIDNELKDPDLLEIVSNLINPARSDSKQNQQQQNIQQQMPPSPSAQQNVKGGDIFESLSFPLEETAEGMSRDKTKPPKTRKAIFNKKDDTYYASILKNVYLDRIELKNFKCFSNLTIQLPSYADDTSVEPWLVFLGENGVGKSSVLKAIAIALMGQEYLDVLGITVKDILKYNTYSGHIKVFGKGNEEVYSVTFNKRKNEIKASIEKPPAFIIGYGSTRLLPIGNLQPEKDHPSYLKIKNLFDPSVSLSSAKEWFLNTNRKTFNQVSKTLKNLLLLDDLDSIKRSPKKGEIFIKYHKSGDNINIDHLSDGYKSIFAVAIDMIYTLSQENVVYELAEGIVLIDEIGTHLHPRWKMEIIERLRNTFPKIQFIITTHEPLCLRGLKEHEVVVLKRDEENAIVAISDLPDPSTLRIDQLLTSEYFGLNSTMDSKTEKEFERYYELLAIEETDRTAAEIAEIEALQKVLPQKKRLGQDAREDLMYHAIDELLAKKMKSKKLKIVDDDIKQETILKVQDIWKNISAKNKL